MDIGLTHGVYTNNPNGIINGIFTGIDRGVNNGIYNENMLKDNITKDGLILYADAHIPQSYPRTGGTWFDLSNQKNNSTLINGATYQTPRNGSFYFNGNGDYINYGDKDIFTFSDGTNDIPFSICCWVNLTSYTGTSMALVTKSQNLTLQGGWYREWFLTHNNTLGLTFAIWNPNLAGDTALINRTSVLNLNQWYFLTATYNANKNNNGMLMYHNAILQSTTTANQGAYTGMGNTIADVNLGRQYLDNNFALSSWFNGNIGSLLIYRNKVLNQSEINNIYQATKSRFNL